jgi:Cof subfamily protein (haloacid dehalogenase superfamily)
MAAENCSMNNFNVQLVIADVDGTLVTQQKELTDRARAAVRKLHERGVRFTITSGRPPRGMQMLIEPLALRDPIAAFNGGLLVSPELKTLREHFLPEAAARKAVEIIRAHKLAVWVYTDQDWFAPERHGPHVDREEWTVKFPPVVVASVEDQLHRAVKITGVSDDFDAVARCEQDVRQECGEQVSAARSQPYYLDVTHPKANKGTVVDLLSEMLHVPRENIATLGDMPNDMLMFRRSGISIAMGQSSDEVKQAARYVTGSNEEEGFALAIERYVLAPAADATARD